MEIQQIIEAVTNNNNNNIPFLTKQFPFLEESKTMKIIKYSLLLLLTAVAVVTAIVIYKIQRSRIPHANQQQNALTVQETQITQPLVNNTGSQDLNRIEEINNDHRTQIRTLDIQLLIHFDKDILCLQDHQNIRPNEDSRLNTEELKKTLSEHNDDQYLEWITKCWQSVLESMGIYLNINENQKMILEGRLHELYFDRLNTFTKTDAPQIYQMASGIKGDITTEEIQRTRTNVLKFIECPKEHINTDKIDELYLQKLQNVYGICGRLPDNQLWRKKRANGR